MIKRVVKNCIPTVFSLMMTGLYSVIDGLFIGRATGDVGLAAINIAWPITAVITSVGIGIGSGGSILLSNYLGRDEQEKSEDIYHNTVLLMIMVGILLTFVLRIIFPSFLKVSIGNCGEVYQEGYKYCHIIVLGCVFQLLGSGFIPLLRNMNMIIHTMVIMIIGMIVNLIANYYLIFNVNLGIQGAALGTMLSQLIVSILSVILIYGYKRKKVRFVWDKRRILKIIRAGISSFGVSIAPSVTLIFTNMQCLRYGGEAAVACYAAISYIVFPVQSMLCGVGDGVQPMISYYNGANKKKQLKRVSKIAKIMATVIGIIAFILVILFTPYIPIWFGLSEIAKSYFSVGMIVSGLSFLILGVVKFNTTYLNATLQVKKAVSLIYGESLIVSPILLWVIPGILNLNGIWLSLVMTYVIMQIIYITCLREKESFIKKLASGNKGEFRMRLKNKAKYKNMGSVLLFILPVLIPLFIFWIYPILKTIYISFTDWDYMTPDYNFIFFDNFKELFSDTRFYEALEHTLVFTLGTLIPTIVLGLLLALLLQKAFCGSSIYKFLLFSPWITPTVAISIVWTWIYEPNIGIANVILEFLQLPALKWINSSDTAMLAVIIVTVWKSLGYAMIFYLSALEKVPPELYEAGSIDGANGLQKFRNITLPSISPTTFFLVIITMVNSLQAYDQIQILTQGGPSGSTRTLLYMYYQLGFQEFNMGQAAAVAVVLIAITAVLSLIQFIASKKWVHY